MTRMIKTLALACAAAAAFPAAAVAAKPPTDEIPFVSFGGIRNWTANSNDTLYVESIQGQWYRVDLAFPSNDLPWALRIGVDTGGSDALDNFSSIVVDGQRYPVASVTAVAAPPSRNSSKSKN